MTKTQTKRFINREAKQTMTNVEKGIIPALQGIGALSMLSQLAAVGHDLATMEIIGEQIHQLRMKGAVSR
jgi:hypothetical protein